MPKPKRGDEELPQRIVRLLKARDREGLVLLYDHYAPALYRILSERLPSEEVAEEALQDVLLRTWENIHQYQEDKGRFFTWLARITRNKAIDISRSKGFKQRARTHSIPDSVYNDNTFSEQASVSDPGLRKVLQKLTSEEQKIIDLLYFKGYTHKEASEALEMPLGTVKTRVRKAMKQLRTILGNEGFLRLFF